MFIMEPNHFIPIGFHLKDMFLSVQLTTFLGDQVFLLKSSLEKLHSDFTVMIGGILVMHSLKDSYDQYYLGNNDYQIIRN